MKEIMTLHPTFSCRPWQMLHTLLTFWRRGKLLRGYVWWTSGRCRSLPLTCISLCSIYFVNCFFTELSPFLYLQVLIGGGRNHRMGLFDMVMIKDNHISTAGGVTNALKSVDLYLEKNNLQMGVEVVFLVFNVSLRIKPTHPPTPPKTKFNLLA